MSNPLEMQLPTDFGSYRIMRKLGKGGMGNVYEAQEKGMKRRVALKITESALNLSEDDIRRFEVEAQAMMEMNHPNIVQVFAYDLVEDRQFIAMQLIEGKNLREEIRKGPLNFPKVVSYTKQIAKALQYAHRKGVVHRDVKPSNILIGEDKRLFLSDFGISYILESDRLTSPGMAMGTPEYMSPEQCQGKEISPLSDVYSLGIIIYEMLCGQPPFTGPKPMTTAWKQVHETPTPISEKRNRIPAKLEAIVQKCLEKDPEDRYHDLEQLMRDLDSIEFGRLNQENAFSAIQRWLQNLQIIFRKKGLLTLLIIFLLLSNIAQLLWNMRQNDSVYHKLDEFQVFRQGSEEDLEQIHDEKEQSFIELQYKSQGSRPVLEVKFDRPVLVFAIGITTRASDSLNVKSQKGHRRPVEITLTNPQTKYHFTQVLEKVTGMQHFQLQHPLSGRQFTLEMDKLTRSGNAPVSINELEFYGVYK